jgi:hypothetical protein
MGEDILIGSPEGYYRSQVVSFKPLALQSWLVEGGGMVSLGRSCGCQCLLPVAWCVQQHLTYAMCCCCVDVVCPVCRVMVQTSSVVIVPC